MELLPDIPWSYPPDTFLRDAGLSGHGELIPAALAFAEAALARLRPKAVYTEARVRLLDDDRVSLDGLVFTSPLLFRILDDGSRVHPFVVSSGNELEDMDLSPFDELAYYWRDIIKASAQRQGEEFLVKHISEACGEEALYMVNPGAANSSYWDIREMELLFSFFPGITGKIGVELNAACFMTPNKTTAGLLFPSAVPYTTCSFCLAENCRERRSALLRLG